MVRHAVTHADKIVADAQNLVVGRILQDVQAGVAEGGQGICCNGGVTVLSDSDDGGYVKFSLMT